MEMETQTLLMRISTYAFLLVIIFVKVFALERAIMSRFVEDYSDEKHSLYAWVEKCFRKTDENPQEAEEVAQDQIRSSDGEESERDGPNFSTTNIKLLRNHSENYLNHVQAQKRHTTNF